LCFCSLRYPTCKAHAPYYIVIGGLSGFTNFFFHILAYTIRFSGKSYWAYNVCFDFLYNNVWNISHYKNNWTKAFHVKCPLFMSDFSENWIFSTDFRKILQYQISWKSVQWEPSCSMRKGTHDQTNRRFLQFCECASRQMPVAGWPVLRNYFDKRNPA
jgi:hypothetical protein